MMKINKTQLQNALEIVKPGLANKEVIQQATSFAFKNGRVITFNDSISISHPVSGLDITGAIKAEELYQLLTKLKKEEIELEVTEEEILITCGKSKAGLILKKEITLPLEEVGSIGKWKDLPPNFVEALKFTINTTSSDMSRPLLTCVHIMDDIVESSDGFCISKFILSQKIKIKEVLIPANSVRELIKLNPIKIAEGNGWVHFKTEWDAEISCRIYEDKFVDLTNLLKISGKNLSFPKTFNDVLDKVSIFSKRDHVMDESISIEIENNKIKVRSKSDTGWFEEESNMKYSDEKILFFITPSLLKTILSKSNQSILGKEKIKFTGENWEYIAILRINPDKE